MKSEFNLLREPWICVLDGGTAREVSLVEALRGAHKISRIAGELPTQDVAVLRLLLAVMYATYAQTIATFRSEDDAVEFWRSLWERGSLDIVAIEAYLQPYEDRFWLFDNAAPFYQCAGLKKRDGGGPNNIAPIITDVPSRAERRFFTNRSGDDVLSLSFPEAARWLINLQAWDYAGKKASVVGGAENGGGTGWLGKLGVVYASRDTLYETLALNFILTQSDGSFLALGKPVWERPAQAPPKDERIPSGYADLLTWQSRRAQIFKDGDRVTSMLASYGDVFEKENTFIEQMSGWHLSSEKSNADKFIPNTHRADRSMWRDLSSLLPGSDDSQKNKPPGIIHWIELLRDNDAPRLEYVNLLSVGAEFGAMQGVITEIVSDSVTLNAAILSHAGRDWVTRICAALKKTEDCVSALRRFVRRLEIAAGNSNDPKAKDKSSVDAAASQAYFDLDLPFRRWLKEIDPAKDDVDDKSAEWYEIVRKLLFAQAEELLENAGTRALTGTNSVIPEHAKFTSAIYTIIRGE
jgi:CRISPR system Cascade subunit CasA